MKHTQIANYLKLGILFFGILLIMVNCQKVEFEQTHNLEEEDFSKWKLNKKSWQELQNNDSFNSAIRTVLKNESFNNQGLYKTVMEEQYGFTIDSTAIKEMVLDSITSYTMLIKREEESSLFFENLVVQINQDSVRAYIVKYNLLEAPSYNQGHDSYGINATTEITAINYNINQVTKTAEVCI